MFIGKEEVTIASDRNYLVAYHGFWIPFYDKEKEDKA